MRGQLTLLALSVLLSARAAVASEAVTLLPADPNVNWSLHVHRGICDHPICTLMTELAMQFTKPRPDLCGLLDKPMAHGKGIRQPIWQHENFRDHLDEIRMAIVADNVMYTLAPVGKHLRPAEYEALKQEFWDRFGTQIIAAFARGEASYEATKFDFDNDDIPDSLYRISQLEPVAMEPAEHPRIPAPNTAWRPATCDEERKFPLYHLFLAPEEESRLPHNYFLSVSTLLKELGGQSSAVFQVADDSFLLKGRSRHFWLAKIESNGDTYFRETDLWIASLFNTRGDAGYRTKIQLWSGTK